MLGWLAECEENMGTPTRYIIIVILITAYNLFFLVLKFIPDYNNYKENSALLSRYGKWSKGKPMGGDIKQTHA